MMVFLFISGCGDGLEGPFIVQKVIDGDTITLDNSLKVRFSGINTPETGECYYKEAKDYLAGVLLYKEIYLERDRTNIDKYDRLLRYVYFDGNMVNSALVEGGFAKVFDKYKDDTKRYDELKEIEAVAKGKNRGLWACEDKKQG